MSFASFALRRRARSAPWGKPHANSFDETDMALIRDCYARTHRGEPPIDDITWNDLDMDALYKRLNGTRSAAGDNFLYATLRAPLAEPSAVRARDEKIRSVSRESVREQLERILKRLGRDYRLNWGFLLGGAQPPSFGRLAAHIAQAALLLAALALFALRLEAGMYLFLTLLIVNAVTVSLSQKRMAGYVPTILWAMRLLSAARAIRRVDEGLMPESILSPLRRFSAGSVVGALYSDSIPAMFARFFFLTDLILYERFLFQLSRFSSKLNALMTAVGEVDALLAVGSWRAEMEGAGENWCAPDFADSAQAPAQNADCIRIEELRHPLIAHCAPNSVCIQRPILLTGSNASGKSTFLKAVGLCVILAQSMATCPAKAYCARPHAVLSSMSLKDDLLSGASYFMTEIRSALRILNYAGALPCLALVDEVLRGTNTGERISAACAMLRFLAAKNVRCVAATHDGELTGLLADSYDNFHFAESFENGEMRFDYTLRPGPSNSHNAIHLIESMGGDPRLVREARALWDGYRLTGGWQSAGS